MTQAALSHQIRGLKERSRCSAASRAGWC
ncbi:hypothetical protein [Paenirhodobacter sp.]